MKRRNFNIQSLVVMGLLAATMAFAQSTDPRSPEKPSLSESSAPDSALTPTPPPLQALLEFQSSPRHPRMGAPLEMTLIVRWKGAESVVLRPLKWASIEGLEPLHRTELQSRKLSSAGELENERRVTLTYRPLREGNLDLTLLGVELQRAGAIDTLRPPTKSISIAPAPLLSALGWILILLLLLLSGGVLWGAMRWKKKKATAAEAVDPRLREAERWRELKAGLRGSDEQRSWLGELHDLLRDHLLRTGGDPSMRTEGLIDQRIELERENPAPIAAWGLLRQEVIHYLYGGGIRPVHRNRESLRALRLCLNLDEEDLT